MPNATGSGNNFWQPFYAFGVLEIGLPKTKVGVCEGGKYRIGGVAPVDASLLLLGKHDMLSFAFSQLRR